TISPAAATMASRCSAVTTSSSALARAAAALTRASAWTSDAGSGRPLIGKFCTARWVCARQSASAGTSTSPMESCSVRVCAEGPGELMPPTLPVAFAPPDVEPVPVVAVLEPDVVAALLGLAEDRPEVLLQLRLAGSGPDDDGPAGR